MGDSTRKRSRVAQVAKDLVVLRGAGEDGGVGQEGQDEQVIPTPSDTHVARLQVLLLYPPPSLSHFQYRAGGKGLPCRVMIVEVEYGNLGTGDVWHGTSDF